MNSRYKKQRVINPRILKQKIQKRSQKHQKQYKITFQLDDLSFESFGEENEELQDESYQDKTKIQKEIKKNYVMSKLRLKYRKQQKFQKTEDNQAKQLNSKEYQDMEIPNLACSNIYENTDYHNQQFNENYQENQFQYIQVIVGDLNEQNIAVKSKPREWSIKIFEEINSNKTLSGNFNEQKNMILAFLEKENCYLMEFLNSQKKQDLFQGFFKNHLAEYFKEIKYDQNQQELEQEVKVIRKLSLD
ncbi:hypothetical protein ABPG72_019018 [Tetrahymena utriculariae]